MLTRHDLGNRIAVLMGGRASEALIFDGEVSTGAADDLQRATEIAMQMVTRFGMDETVGQRTYSAPPQQFLGIPAGGIEASEMTEREIDVAVRRDHYEGLRAGDCHPAHTAYRARRRRPPAACAGDVDRRSIPRDPARNEGARNDGLTPSFLHFRLSRPSILKRCWQLFTGLMNEKVRFGSG